MINKIVKIIALLALVLAGNVQAAQSVTFYHHDALGSVIAKSDSDGYLYLNEEYQPYGEKIYATEDFFGGSDDWYTGKNYSEELDLTYFGARWYDAKQGRFLSVDPAPVEFYNLHSFNRYVYSNNNPYSFIDPDGENAVTALGGVLTETGKLLTGKGFDGNAVYGALKDGYDGQGSGVAASVFQDATEIIPVGKIAGLAVKGYRLLKGASVTKGADNFVDGYRAVSKAEADDIAKHGFRPDPSGRSMQDKWFSETREGAEKFRKNYSDLDDVVKARVPKDVYDRSYKHPNIDNTGPGFCVACDDLSRLKAGQ